MNNVNSITRKDFRSSSLAKAFANKDSGNMVGGKRIGRASGSPLERQFEDTIGKIDVHYHPDIYEMDDVLEMIDYNGQDLDKVIMMSIMENIELQMVKDLKQNDVVIFPYMGRGKINKAAIDIRRARNNYKELRKEFDRSEYFSITQDITDHSFEMNRELDAAKARESYVRKKFKDEILELRLLYGENYVDLFVKSMSNFKPVPIDAEAQYEFDLVNGNIDEDGNYTF